MLRPTTAAAGAISSSAATALQASTVPSVRQTSRPSLAPSTSASASALRRPPSGGAGVDGCGAAASRGARPNQPATACQARERAGSPVGCGRTFGDGLAGGRDATGVDEKSAYVDY